MTRPTPTYVLIPVHRPAIPQALEALEVLNHPGDRVVVVTNQPHPPTPSEIPNVHLVDDRTPDVNISRWWNKGLDWIEDHEMVDHHVLIMNADTRIAPAGVARLSWALDHHPEIAMAGPMTHAGVHKETRGGFHGFDQRMPGFCFMLTSRHRLRADERFRWWCGDDDLEWRARQEGGTIRVGPVRYVHLGDGQPRGHLLDLAKADLVRFEEKWWTRPW